MKLDLDHLNFSYDLSHYKEQIKINHSILHDSESPYKDDLGWIDLPLKEISELDKIIKYSKEIREHSDILVVVGIGGSYLGGKAVIDALHTSFEVLFIGNNLSESSIKDLFRKLKDKRFSINIISKSGSTIETVVASHILIEYMKDYFNDYRERIYITTDPNKGYLRDYALKHDLKMLSFPSDIGGRYSVLSSALLPIATAGIDILELINGARAQYDLSKSLDIYQNDSYRYAVLRKIMSDKGKVIELLISYEPKIESFQRWWVQLFAESEGKEGKGIFPSYANFSEDLHSLGQLIQEGKRNLFETILHIKNPKSTIEIPDIDDAFLNLKGLKGKKIEDINREVFLSTLLAHTEVGVPNIVIEIDKLDAYSMGEMIYFFELSVAMSGLLIEVNPFNQLGVEVYKSKLQKRLFSGGIE